VVNLIRETTEIEVEHSFDNSVEALTDLWKTKYARKRIASLKKQDRVSKETHFYDDIIFLSWEETKAKYLPQVGR
jgi:thiamine biosynthesis lipoprotein ApbE